MSVDLSKTFNKRNMSDPYFIKYFNKELNEYLGTYAEYKKELDLINFYIIRERNTYKELINIYYERCVNRTYDEEDKEGNYYEDMENEDNEGRLCELDHERSTLIKKLKFRYIHLDIVDDVTVSDNLDELIIFLEANDEIEDDADHENVDLSDDDENVDDDELTLSEDHENVDENVDLSELTDWDINEID